MANKVTQDDIILMNDLYLQIGTYAGVARKVGFSAGTVKKYIIEDYVPIKKMTPFSGELKEAGTFLISHEDLSQEEWDEIEKLREEIAI